ncbi:AlpA family transcriptional regulator [Rothia sp. HMSC061D12]|uniref:helix-turn-helix transcriptional regulator n=1 Tax=Rothia sp. HMSC061D12 TaxID=1715161 RepID=UPI0008A9ED6A|nr:helix-turn-helix domain-containing protein [Rothia sp. HMSC061D12]OHP56879.1 hypothetical protein HMPREF2682_03230 [Rothia sp. HMSC061D12]
MLTIPHEGLTIWSPDELAEALGVSAATLADWRTARTGPEFIRTTTGQRGGRVYYTSTAVTAWLSKLPVTHTNN